VGNTDDVQVLFALKKFFRCGVVRRNREEGKTPHIYGEFFIVY